MASLVRNLDGGWHFCHIEKERRDQLLPCMLWDPRLVSYTNLYSFIVLCNGLFYFSVYIRDSLS